MCLDRGLGILSLFHHKTKDCQYVGGRGVKTLGVQTFMSRLYNCLRCGQCADPGQMFDVIFNQNNVKQEKFLELFCSFLSTDLSEVSP